MDSLIFLAKLKGSILLASQAGTHLPPGEGSSLVVSQAGRQANIFMIFPGRCSPSPWGRKQFSGIYSLSGRCSPSPREESNLAASQATQAGSGFLSLRGRQQLSSNCSGSSPIPGNSTSSQAGSKATTNTPV